MITVTLPIKRYACSMESLTNLAAEHFGRVLDGAGMGDSATLDFGFEGDEWWSTATGITLDGHARHCAAAFKALLNTPTWLLAESP